MWGQTAPGIYKAKRLHTTCDERWIEAWPMTTFSRQHSAARSYSKLFPVPFTRAHLSRGSRTYSHTSICTPTLPVTEHHHTFQSPLLSFSVFPFPPHVVPPGVFLLPAPALPHINISHPPLVGGVPAYLSSAGLWLMSYFLPVRIFQNLAAALCLLSLRISRSRGEQPVPTVTRRKHSEKQNSETMLSQICSVRELNGGSEVSR